MSQELRNVVKRLIDLQLFAEGGGEGGDGGGQNNPPSGGGQTFTAEYVRDLRNEAADYRTKLREAEKQRDELQTRLKALEDGTNALLTRAREALKLDANADLNAVTQKLVEAVTAADGMGKKAQEALMKAAFAAAATKANVIDVDAAYKLADLGSVKADLESMSVYPVDKDGKPLTKDGKPVTGLDDVVTALLTAKPYLKAQGGVGGTSGQIGGGTNPPGAGGAEVNPWKKETLNLTQQAKMLKENPALAARLKAEAGVK